MLSVQSIFATFYCTANRRAPELPCQTHFATLPYLEKHMRYFIALAFCFLLASPQVMLVYMPGCTDRFSSMPFPIRNLMRM
jgi:hypothetical protein